MADITVTAAQVAPIFPANCEIIDLIAAETITAGAAVYIVAASGRCGLADANQAGKQQFRGVALNGGGAGQAISVLKRGHVSGFAVSGMNADALVYLSDTDTGILADTNGTMNVQCGRVVCLTDANATKVIYVNADWLRAWT